MYFSPISLSQRIVLGDASASLKEAATSLEAFMGRTLEEVVNEVHQGQATWDPPLVDPELQDELIDVILAIDAQVRPDRLAAGYVTLWDRMATTTLADLFDTPVSGRLLRPEPEGQIRRSPLPYVAQAFAAHPDMKHVTLLDFWSDTSAVRRRLSERPGFGDGVMKEIVRRAWSWIELTRHEFGDLPPDGEVRAPSGIPSFFPEFRRNLEDRSGKTAFDLAMAFLAPRDALALKLHHGLDGLGCRTFADMATELGVSAGRAHVVHGLAWRRLRHPRPNGLLRRHLQGRSDELDRVFGTSSSRKGASAGWQDRVDPRDLLALKAVHGNVEAWIVERRTGPRA